MIGIPGLHSEIGYPLVISGSFYFIYRLPTLCINCLINGNSVHMYKRSCIPVAIYMK